MNCRSPFLQLRIFTHKLFTSSVCLPIFALVLASHANAQNIFSFKDDSQLSEAMSKLAALAIKNSALPEPCRLHIVSIAGGRELFVSGTFDKMNEGLARGVVGGRPLSDCAFETHELGRDGADDLLARLKPQGENVLILEATYIPLPSNIVAFTKLRDGTGRNIGESGRYDLPVTRADIVTAAIAAPKLSVNPKPASQPNPAPEPAAISKPEPGAPVEPAGQLLTEVHFDPGSANITLIGKEKIKQAAEAIKKQNPREIRILGYTDSIGNAETNKAVASARADNVARLLKQAGIDAPLVVEGIGEEGGPYKTPDGVSEPLNRCVGIIAVGAQDGK